jgi:hypothetical protein
MPIKKDKIKTIRAKMEEARRVNEEHAKGAMEEIFGDAFEQAPDLLRVTWLQYTPYFNDGAPCVFRLNEPDYLVKGLAGGEDETGHEAEEGAGWVSSYGAKDEKDLPAATKRVLADLTKVFAGNDDVFLQAFGDHVEVVAKRTAKGIAFETEECEHD